MHNYDIFKVNGLVYNRLILLSTMYNTSMNIYCAFTWTHRVGELWITIASSFEKVCQTEEGTLTAGRKKPHRQQEACFSDRSKLWLQVKNCIWNTSMYDEMHHELMTPHPLWKWDALSLLLASVE